MRKYKRILIRVIISISIIFIIISLFNFYLQKNFYKQIIGTNLPKSSTILKNSDTHGGFHGDGEYYAEIKLTDEGKKKFVSKVKKTGGWNPLPVSHDIKIFLWGEEIITDTHITEVAGHSPDIPKDISNGIYYVRDRYVEHYPEYKNTNINSRYSYNITVYILDFDTNILYIFTLDT